MTALGLLGPRIQASLGAWRRSGAATRRRSSALAALGALFWLAIFAFFVRVLAYFQGVPELGPVLAERLLGMVFLTFFGILLFSNIVTALSTYFLSADLGLLLTAPQPPGRVHVARFLETLWDSSWMILLFGLPVFLAYGVVHHAGPAFYGAVLATLPPFLVVPCAVGTALTMILVRFFPARSTRDVFVLLSVVAVALLYTMLRFLQPERLVRPEAFADFLGFLAAMQAPSSPWLPPAWATGTLVPFFDPRPGLRSPLVQYLALLSTAGAAFVACSMVAERVYAAGWSRAQEGRRARFTRLPVWDRVFARLPFSAVFRALVLKDSKTFFRDTTQWSQLILLVALVVVYAYNFSVLPKVGGFAARLYLEHALAFLNLTLAGFVVASVAVRFLFPGFSLEGRSFWLLQTAPIRLRALWWSKFWSGIVPLAGLGLLLVLLGNRAVGVDGTTMAVSLVTLALMSLAIAALGLCVGAYYPRFDYENAAKIPTSFGGVVYMILAILLIFANVVLEAWPVYRILFARLTDRELAGTELGAVVGCFALVAVFDLGIFVASTRLGIRRLERLSVVPE